VQLGIQELGATVRGAKAREARARRARRGQGARLAVAQARLQVARQARRAGGERLARLRRAAARSWSRPGERERAAREPGRQRQSKAGLSSAARHLGGGSAAVRGSWARAGGGPGARRRWGERTRKPAAGAERLGPSGARTQPRR
jgi:hypothetical protein